MYGIIHAGVHLMSNAASAGVLIHHSLAGCNYALLCYIHVRPHPAVVDLAKGLAATVWVQGYGDPSLV